MSIEKRKVIVSFNDDGSPVIKWLKAYSQDEMNVKIVKAFVESGRIKEILPSFHFDNQTKKGIILKDYAFEWLKRKRKLKENTAISNSKPMTFSGLTSSLHVGLANLYGRTMTV